MSIENHPIDNPIEELPTGEMEEETSGFLDEENSGKVKKWKFLNKNDHFSLMKISKNEKNCKKLPKRFKSQRKNDYKNSKCNKKSSF